MCGIAGIITLNNSPINCSKQLQQMANAMRHRGPDDEGYLVAHLDNKPATPLYGNESCEPQLVPQHYRPEQSIEAFQHQTANIFLAHRRLAIVDLEPTGHQPLSDPTQRYWIVYNGEIYNYKEIAKELTSHGIKLFSQSDTEVVLQAYLLWGAEALQRFNGMFAFAIWDNQEKTLFCARDRVGIKPFYYTLQDNLLLFASEIKTLSASKLYTAEADLEGLYHAMSYGVTPRPNTCFKGVKALRPAEWMSINTRSGKIHKQTYWQIHTGQQDHSLSEKQAVDLLDEALSESVRYRLISDVPVGTFMSGGIDSTTISSIAAKQHPHIKAFTLGYDSAHDKYNEIEQAQATAKLCDMEHIIHRENPDTLLNSLEDIIKAYEEPFFALSPNYIISKVVASNQVKVVLNGLGGDELFAGYNTFGIAKHHRLLKPLLPAIKLMSLAAPKLKRSFDVAYAKGLGDYQGAIMNNMSAHEKDKLFLQKPIAENCSLEKLRELYFQKDQQFTDITEAMCYMYVMNYISNHHVYRVDQFTMRFSIESRLPFLDHNVIETAFKIPSAYKLKGSTKKHILREVAKRHVHPSCLTMKKKGFKLPMDHWMKNQLKPLIYEKINQLNQRGLFHTGAVNEILNGFFKNRHDNFTLWQLVGIELWFEHLIDP